MSADQPRISWVRRREPCPTCGVMNMQCALPPGVVTHRVGDVGLYCSCGWVWGMGNELGAERAFDNHVLSEAGIEAMHA